MQMHDYVCKGCDKPFRHRRRDRVFCSNECRFIIYGWPLASLRFHARRAGSVAILCEAIGISQTGYYKQVPRLDVDLLHLGEMVNIGGILAKRCSHCEVTKELAAYGELNSTKSGASPCCVECRRKKILAKPNSVV